MGSLFKKPSMPPPPPPIPDAVPLPDTDKAEEQGAIQIQKKKKGYTNTILTSNQGVTDEAQTFKKTLLGG